MPVTYDSLATTTLGSATTTISFQSISSGYSDLRIVFRGQMAGNDTEGIACRINNLSGANYYQTAITTQGSVVSGSTNSGDTFWNLLSSSSLSWERPSMIIMDFINYNNAQSANPGILIKNSNERVSTGTSGIIAGTQFFLSNSPINRIDIYVNGSGNFAIGTTAALYGILRA